jgi:hypothetical protein
VAAKDGTKTGGRKKGTPNPPVQARRGEVPLGKRVVPEVPAPADPTAREREREEFVARLMLSGLPLGQIAEQAARALGLDRKATRVVYDRLCERWSAETAEMLKHARALAINRLRRDLAQMRNPLPLRDPRTGALLTAARLDAFGRPVKVQGGELRDPIPGEVDWRAVTGHERLLASIEGTLRPVEVTVDLVGTQRRSLAALVSGLSAEDLEELEDEGRLLTEDAGDDCPRGE